MGEPKLTPAQERLLVEVCDGVRTIHHTPFWGFSGSGPKPRPNPATIAVLHGAGYLRCNRAAAIKAREQGNG